MPPAWGGEDRQPNELRINRKGSTNVPLVRSSASRWTARLDTSQSYCGRGRGSRGVGRGYGHPISSRTLTTPVSSQRGRINSSGWSAAASTHIGQGNSYRPHFHSPRASVSNAIQQGSNPQKRLSDISDSRQAKRPCFDNKSNEQSHSGIDQISSLLPSNKAPKKGHQKAPRIEIRLDVPLHCRKGVHGYHKSRHQWLDREIQRIQEKRQVAVHHTEFLDREVRLLCHSQTPSQSPIKNEISTGEFALNFCAVSLFSEHASRTSRICK